MKKEKFFYVIVFLIIFIIITFIFNINIFIYLKNIIWALSSVMIIASGLFLNNYISKKCLAVLKTKTTKIALILFPH